MRSIEFYKGTTRWVFLIGNYAIKIPSLSSWKQFLNGLLANMQEREFSKMDKSSWHYSLIADVHYCDPLGFLLIMERADYTLSEFTTNPWERHVVENLFKECEKQGVPVDKKLSNVGKFAGHELKLIDYGN